MRSARRRAGGGLSLNSRMPLSVTLWLLVASTGTSVASDETAAKMDSGDTAWMLVSTGLVLLMVPGLALFYGGMVRRKNVLGTMMHCMVALALIGMQWVLFGYALAFGA